MRAIVATKSGSTEVLELQEVLTPKVKPGWILLRNKAFGINRAEILTREGQSPGVTFPRILGIEAVGIVEKSKRTNLPEGSKAATLMGGMGRAFDGSYAEYILVPEAQVFPFKSDLPWSILGAIPELFQTVNGALFQSLNVKKGESLLIRGGTSSIGLLAIQIANQLGLEVFATTRSMDKFSILTTYGAKYPINDKGVIENKIKEINRAGVDKVLDLTGTETLHDTLKCAKPQGTVCLAGILSGHWGLEKFSPMFEIPTSVKLTSYVGDYHNLTKAELQDFIVKVEQGAIKIPLASVFKFGEVKKAHQLMESNKANGKIVVTI